MRQVEGDDAVDARMLELVRRLSPSERLVRMFALSSFIRAFTWEGAKRHVRNGSREAIVERFLAQMYGADLDERVRQRVVRGE
jgi:hypothetical protein